MDEDLEQMNREALIDEARKLRQGIREHRDSSMHALCWHHPALWGLLPDKSDAVPVVPEWPEFLKGCIRYRLSLDEQLPAAARSSAPYGTGSGPTLETARLLLRAFRLSDAADVQRLAGDYAIADTTLNVPHPYPDGTAEQWIATHQPAFEAGEAATFAVVLRQEAGVIGAVGMRFDARFDNAELGYWIGRPYWGRGYCTEAAGAVLDYAFDELKLNRVHASHLVRNPASGRVMQKLGMSREGLRRQHVKKWERYEDLADYGILRDEWRDREWSASSHT